MKRKLLALFILILSLCLCFALASCGGEDEEVTKTVSVVPGDITEVPSGYTKAEKTTCTYIYPSSWIDTGNSVVNYATGEHLTMLIIDCESDYVHKSITTENFDSVVGKAFRQAFYDISNVKYIGNGYFTLEERGETWTMRVEYSEEYNSLYCLVSTATDPKVENNFFGSFAFASTK